MKSRMFAAFGLGALTATISLGAVQYVSAANDSKITACVNKSTGSMRHLTKGACKKSERKLTWNQSGPQFAAAQDIHVVDASGKDFGVPLKADSNKATVLYDGGVWTLYNQPKPNIEADGNGSASNTLIHQYGLFYDRNCSLPFLTTAGKTNPVPLARAIVVFSDGTRKYYKAAGSPFSGSSITNFYSTAYGGPCRPSSDASFPSSFLADVRSSTVFYTNVIEVNPPDFLAPFTLISR